MRTRLSYIYSQLKPLSEMETKMNREVGKKMRPPDDLLFYKNRSTLWTCLGLHVHLLLFHLVRELGPSQTPLNYAPNLTDELSMAEERRLNQFGSAG